VFGTEKFRKYLEHQEFILETDNEALSWLLSHPRQLGKIWHWVAKISALKFQVCHIRGTQNIVADTLSRMFESSTSETLNQVECHITLTNFPLAFHDVGQLQKEDPVLTGVVAQLENSKNIGNYFLSKGILYCQSRSEREPKLVVAAVATSIVCTYFH
jgi:hypothetical protein